MKQSKKAKPKRAKPVTATESGNASDGKYAYRGKTKEINVDVKDEKAFSDAAAAYARRKICEKVGCKNLTPTLIDIDTRNGVFEIQFVDQDVRKPDKIKHPLRVPELHAISTATCPVSPTTPISGPWYHIQINTRNAALKGMPILTLDDAMFQHCNELGIAAIVSFDDQLAITRYDR